MSEPVKGEDYLVDYYAILGIEKDVSTEEITLAYRAKQKQWHPDQLHGRAPELIGRAQHMTALIIEAYAILHDPEKRDVYDAELFGWEKPISTNGTPIVDISMSGFSFSLLVGNLQLNSEEREAKAEQLALQFSNFNKATYEFFRQQADSPAGMPEALKEPWLEQLAARDLYLSLREGFVWDSVGLRNHRPAARLEYVEQTQEDLELVRKQAAMAVEQEVALLAIGQRAVLLLPAPEGVDVETDPTKALAHYQAQLDQHLERQSALLEPLAKEREEVLKARFSVAAEITYHPLVTVYTDKLIVELKLPGESRWFGFTYGEHNHVAGDEVDVDDPANPETTKRLIDEGYTILSFKLVQGIDIHSQLEQVISLHGDRRNS